MREMAILLLHIITTALRLLRPGAAGSIIAESLLVKHQLLIINRSRHREPNLNRAVRSHPTPRFLSSDHDPLYRFHRWKANLRIRKITEIKTVPYVPLSHPFMEQLIGTIRRECLDRTLFWNERDLEYKLADFADYYNRYRVHSSLHGSTPTVTDAGMTIHIRNYRWQSHCRGLYQTPIAA